LGCPGATGIEDRQSPVTKRDACIHPDTVIIRPPMLQGFCHGLDARTHVVNAPRLGAEKASYSTHSIIITSLWAFSKIRQPKKDMTEFG